MAGTRVNITYGSTDIIRTLPFNELLPINTEINVTAKADGYLYQKYSFDTGSQTALQIQLPKDPALDLSVTFTQDELNKFGITRNGAANKIRIRVDDIYLSGQREKSKRIIDDLLSKNVGLRFLTAYTSALSGDPLNGVPIVYETYRVLADLDNTNPDDGAIRFDKMADDDEVSRVGIAFVLPDGTRYRAPSIAGKGNVVFDNPVVQDFNLEQFAGEIAEELGDGSLATAISNSLAPRFNTLDTAVAAIPTTGGSSLTAADVWNYEIIAPQDDGQGGMTPAISAETYLDTSIPQTIQTSQAAIIAAVNGIDLSGVDLSSLSVPTAAQIATAVWAKEITADPAINAQNYLISLKADAAILLGRLTNNRANRLDRLVNDVPSLVQIQTQLEGSGSSIATLLARLTAARAAHLDADISSRLAASAYTAPPAIPAFPTVPTVAQIRAEMEKNGTSLATLITRITAARMAHLDANISSRLATSGYTAPPSLEDIWQHVPEGYDIAAIDAVEAAADDASTLITRLTMARAGNLDNLDAAISTRLATTGYTAPPAAPTVPTVSQIRTELEKAGTKLTELQSRVDTNLNASISSRLAGADYTAPDNTKITGIKTQTDKLRFTGTVDEAGTQKVAADATVTGTVESSGLTDAQASQLDSIYNETVADDDNTMTNLAEKVDAIKTDTTAIKTTTDKIGFNGSNDVKVTLDGEEVVTNAASRTASKATGFATPADITAARTAITTAITNKAVTPVNRPNRNCKNNRHSYCRYHGN